MGVFVRRNVTVLPPRNSRILLDERFNGGAVDESVWTKTDSQAGNPHISVSAGNLVIAAPPGAWVNTSLVSKAPHVWARQAGLSIEWEVTPGATNTELLAGWTDGSLAANAAEAHGIYPKSTGVLSVIVNAATGIVTPATYTATSTWLRIVLLATGALYYVSSDNRATWKIIWADAAVTTTPLYAFIESYNAALTADRCRVIRDSVQSPVVNAVSQTVTPTLGAELLANNGFETFTAGQADSWDKEGLPTLASEASIIHGGTYSQKITNVGGGNQGVNQYKGTTSGQWYLFRVWGYAAASSTISLQFYTNGGADQIISGGTSDQAWSELVASARALGANSAVYARVATDTHVGYVDDASIVPLTLSTLLGDTQTARKEALWDCAVSGLTSGRQAGMWVNTDGLDDGNQDAIEVIIDRAAGTFRVSKYVAGTLTNNLISSAVTYAENCVLRAIRVGNSVAFYYAQDGTTFVQVGTTQTISDQTIISQTGFRAFSTDSAATCTLTARGGEGIA